MKTEQGEIPALFSCREAWGWAMPRRGWRADSGAGGGLSPVGRSIASGGDPKGVQGGERKAPSAPAGANPCPGGA